MPRRKIFTACIAVALCFIQFHAFSQQTINLWPGTAPGSEGWKQKEQTIKNTPVGTVVLNVVTPTITAYFPEKEKATGTGIIIAPGGACIALAMNASEELAESFRKKGIATFVLKYRLQEKKGDGIPTNLNEDTACLFGIKDAVQAIELVRSRASEWNISADKIGFVGFSAGGMIASETMLQKDVSERPNFVALMYGAPFASMPEIPANLPPVFMAWAQDDSVAGYAMERFYKALFSSGQKPEAHIYNSGGHGFGAKKQGATSDNWMEELYYWLKAQGFAGK